MPPGGHDAQWADELHHELHVLLSGETFGHYEGYGSVSGLARQLERKPAERLVVCSQNHDQVGNRAFGDRPEEHELEPRARTLLFAPQTPLIFMGQEYGERAPFRFFTDHDDPEIAEATRQGRKQRVRPPARSRTRRRSRPSRRRSSRARRCPGSASSTTTCWRFGASSRARSRLSPTTRRGRCGRGAGEHLLEVDFGSKQASVR